jgi:hypothetical protein
MARKKWLHYIAGKVFVCAALFNQAKDGWVDGCVSTLSTDHGKFG